MHPDPASDPAGHAATPFLEGTLQGDQGSPASRTEKWMRMFKEHSGPGSLDLGQGMMWRKPLPFHWRGS